MENKKTVLVTGANRGIGLEVCRQLAQRGFSVVLTARDAARGEEAARMLQHEGLDISFHPLDVVDEASIASIRGYLENSYGRLDVLINNAGIFPDYHDNVSTISIEKLEEAMRTNAYGPLLLTRTLADLLRGGRVINVSSSMGQIAKYSGGDFCPAYKLSKTSLNMLTRMLSKSLDDILVNAVCPGWVKTHMGGEEAERPVEKGAETIVWLTMCEERHTGKFFRDKQEIPW